MHNFDIEYAIKYGIEQAVILQNLIFWIKKNKANKKNYYDGHYWTYNSAKAFEELFPYFTKQKISRLLRKMEEDGLIKSGNYNKSAYDRTKWFRINENSIIQKETLDCSNMNNGVFKSESPIPYINPDNNQYIKNIKKDTTDVESLFFLNYKGRKIRYSVNDLKDFEKARNIFKGTKRGNETEFIDFIKKHKDWKEILPILFEKIDYQIKAKQKLDDAKVFNANWKNLKTWINQKCWEDEIEKVESKDRMMNKVY